MSDSRRKPGSEIPDAARTIPERTGNRERQVIEDIAKILFDKMREHEAVMQSRAPADEFFLAGIFPKARDERAQEKLLGQAHAGVRRHFEGAQFHQAEPSAAAVGRIKLVDAKFGPVGVAAGVNQKIPENAVHQPWRDMRRRRESV